MCSVLVLICAQWPFTPQGANHNIMHWTICTFRCSSFCHFDNYKHKNKISKTNTQFKMPFYTILLQVSFFFSFIELIYIPAWHCVTTQARCTLLSSGVFCVRRDFLRVRYNSGFIVLSLFSSCFRMLIV